ncbi:MAG TPA: hypothetical protein VGB85_07310 [Nannocystis sp.]
MISNPLRCSLLALALAPTACTFPVKAGDDINDPADEDPSPPGDVPTGGPAEPGFCGDGIVGDGEACDDGNDDPADACDSACQPTGAVEWTYRTGSPWTANAVAVGPAGRIVVVGDGEVLALEPDGQEAWLRVMPPDSHAFNSAEIDELGTIYVAGEVGTMHALAPDGDELWRSDVGQNYRAIALGHGALYSVDSDVAGPFEKFIVRRHDRATGAVVWTTESPKGIDVFAHRMAVTGPRVVVVGAVWSPEGDPTLPLVSSFDESGALQAFELGDAEELTWEGVAATPNGDLALVGHASDIVVARVGADLSPQWALADEQGSAWTISSGAQGELAIVGANASGSFVRRLDAAGATVWTNFYGPVGAPSAVEFGPGFLVAIGNEEGGIWVRRISD